MVASGRGSFITISRKLMVSATKVMGLSSQSEFYTLRSGIVTRAVRGIRRSETGWVVTLMLSLDCDLSFETGMAQTRAHQGTALIDSSGLWAGFCIWQLFDALGKR